MPAPIVRKTVYFAVALSILAVLGALALPWVASTQIVRDRIADELATLSGYDVTLGSSPDIRYFPSFRAVLRDVRFHAAADRPAVLVAESIEANLLALASLEGRIVFSGLTFERPTLRVNPHPAYGYLPDPPLSGRLPPLLGLLEGAARGDGLTEIRLGTVRFNDARVLLVQGDQTTDLVTSLNGTIGWPGAGRPASLNASAIWRGEQVAVSAYATRPEAYFGNGQTPLTVSVDSTPFKASFEGTAELSDRAVLNGTLTASSPSLRRALQWSNTEIAPGSAVGAVSIRGALSGSLQRFRISQTEIELDGNRGLGALEFASEGGPPSISGTLDFDTLDLGSFVEAFLARRGRDEPARPVFDLSLTDQIGVDLRLSADRARAWGADLSEVAATAQVKRGLAAFDISDATAFGGILQAGFRIDRKAEGDIGELSVNATDLDFAAASAAGVLPFLAPRATGSATLRMQAPMGDWSSMSRNLKGSLTASFGAGSVDGIDLAALLGYRPKASFFPLSAVASGSVGFEKASIEATLAYGSAALDSAVVQTPTSDIRVDGVVTYVGRSLALSAAVTPRQQQGGEAQTRRFFVGGSWSAPYVSTVAAQWLPE